MYYLTVCMCIMHGYGHPPVEGGLCVCHSVLIQGYLPHKPIAVQEFVFRTLQNIMFSKVFQIQIQIMDLLKSDLIQPACYQFLLRIDQLSIHSHCYTSSLPLP